MPIFKHYISIASHDSVCSFCHGIDVHVLYSVLGIYFSSQIKQILIDLRSKRSESRNETVLFDIY